MNTSYKPLFLSLLLLLAPAFGHAAEEEVDISKFKEVDHCTAGELGNDYYYLGEPDENNQADMQHKLTSARLGYNGAGYLYTFKFPEATTKYFIDEKERDPQFLSDLKVIASMAKTINAKSFVENAKSPALTYPCLKYKQKYSRSKVTIMLSQQAAEPSKKFLSRKLQEEINQQADLANNLTPQKAKDETTAKPTEIEVKDEVSAKYANLIAGKTEYVYFAVDLPVTKISQLTYDDKSGKVIEKEKPPSFYVSGNIKFGDIFTNYPVGEFYRNLSLKGLLKASSRPSESMGIGLAYKFKAFDFFAAHMRTKDSQGASGEDLGASSSTAIGISLDIGRGVDWLKD